MLNAAVQVVRPGRTYVGKQGFTYGAGVSAETVGAARLCMNVLPMRPGAPAKAHFHDGIVLLPELDALLAAKVGSPTAG